MKNSLKVVVVGCTPLAEKITCILEENFVLAGVVNLHPLLGATKSNYVYIDRANKNIPTYWTRDINDKETKAWLIDKEPDVIVQCGWSQIFKKEILDIPKRYCLGFHPSPLPIGRGAAVLNWKIIQSCGQDIQWGNTLFVMEPTTDTGEIIDFEPFIIEQRDDIRTAYLKVDYTSCKMMERTLSKLLSGAITGQKQDSNRSTRFYKRRPKDGLMHMEWNAIKIHDYVRALTHPYPGAFFETKKGSMIVWKTQLLNTSCSHPIGQIIRIGKDGVILKVGDESSILLKRVTYNHQEYWADEIFHEIGLIEGESLCL